MKEHVRPNAENIFFDCLYDVLSSLIKSSMWHQNFTGKSTVFTKEQIWSNAENYFEDIWAKVLGSGCTKPLIKKANLVFDNNILLENQLCLWRSRADPMQLE